MDPNLKDSVTLTLSSMYREFALNFDKEPEADLEQLRTLNELHALLRQVSVRARESGLSVDEHQVRRESRIERLEPGGASDVWHTLTAVGGIAGIAALLRAVQPILVQWLKNRAAGSISVKTTSSTITIKGVDDIAKAAELLGKLTKDQQPNQPASPVGKLVVTKKKSSKPAKAMPTAQPPKKLDE